MNTDSLFDLPEPEPVTDFADRIRRAEENRAGLASRDSKPTQRAGARDVAPKSGTRRKAVLDALLAHHGGLTDEELENHLVGLGDGRRWTYGDYAPRRRELVGMGLVADSGRTRIASTGSTQIVWVAT